MKLTNYILDAIFPRYCISCGLLLWDNRFVYLCDKCAELVSDYKEPAECPLCGANSKNGAVCRICRLTRGLDHVFICAQYENPLVQNMIKLLKYQFISLIAKDIAMYMSTFLEEIGAKERLLKNKYLLMPVPLDGKRQAWRGFNQSELITSSLGEITRIGLLMNVIGKKTGLRPQVEVAERFLRLSNIKGAFFCKKPEAVKDKNILLIDDVATTCATLNECAKVLKNSGAHSVIGLVFARGA